MAPLLEIAAVALVCYLISLRLHPWRVCRPCKGSGKHKGSVFSYATRSCTACGGNGKRGRLGVRILHAGGHVWGEKAPNATTARRGQKLGR